MKELNELLVSVSPEAQVVVTRNNETFALDMRTMQKGDEKGHKYYGINVYGDRSITSTANIPNEKGVMTPVSVTSEFTMGVSFENDEDMLGTWTCVSGEASNINEVIARVGKEIIADYLDATLNIKLQAFCKTAYTNVCGSFTAAMSNNDKVSLFTAELSRIVAQWNMRDESKKNVMLEMKQLGAELKSPTITTGRKMEIMLRLSEIATSGAF